MTTIDFLDDPAGLILKAVTSNHPLPPFINLTSTKFGEIGRLEKTAFAWPEERKYPMDTPTDLYLSKLYFDAVRHELPQGVQSKVASTLDTAIALSGLPVFEAPEAPKPTPKLLANEGFALRLPLEKTAAALQTRCANLIQNNEIVMYPTHTPELLKKANAIFPAGLEGPLELFRPYVATKLASLLSKEQLNPEVEQYLPMTETEAVDVLMHRAGLSKEHAPSYFTLIDNIQVLADQPPIKVMEAVSALDKQANLEQYYNKHCKSASVFMRGFVKDKANTPLIVNNRTYASEFVEKAASAIDGFIPNFSTSLDRQSLLKNQPSSVLNVIERIIQNVVI
jgi:hypothetical protein